jgi:gliding motility-associated-like protein
LYRKSIPTMIKARVLKWKTLACMAFLFTWIDVNAQCDLVVNNPPCQAGPVNITSAAITAGSPNVGTLTYWLNPQATAPLANPSAVANSGFYYIKNTVGGCSSIAPVTVTIGNTAPTTPPFLTVLCPFSTTSAIFFDFVEAGQTSFSYSYQVNSGPIVYGSQTSPTSYVVAGLAQGDIVTFTVSYNGVCTPPLKITASPVNTPNFVNNQTLCVGTTLPTTAPNGIGGVWNHPQVTAGTSNYVFTPLRCQNSQTISITGIPVVTPTFNPIPAVCEGSPAPTLPASSTNPTPVTGTWSPATVNTSTTGTQVFTFTPAAGQCATNTATLSVTVNPRITPTFAVYPATLCQNSTAPALPASTNGISGTWNPTTISTTTAGIKTSTFVPNAGQCVSATPVTISVNVVQNVAPTFNPIGSFCAGTAAPALPAASIEGFSGTWSPATISNTASGTYTFTPSATTCATTATLNVTVTPAPITVFNAFPSTNLTICSGSPVSALPAISSNAPAVSGTWSPAAISNTASGTYTFTPTAGQCASPFVLNVTVTPTTTIQFNSLPQNFSICVGSPPPPLPAQSNNTPPVTGSWNAAAIDTATPGVRTYTFQASPGQCVTSFFYTITVDVTPKIIPIYGPILPFCEGTVPPEGLALPTTVNSVVGTWSPWANIDNTITGHTVYTFTPAANQCAETTILNINITPRTVTIFTQQQIPAFCAGTTPIPTLPTISDNGITGTWSPAIIDNMLSGTYTFTPDAGICATVATLDVTVIQPISPGFDDIVFCENAAVPVLETTSPLGINGTWNPAVIDPTVSGATYTFTPDTGECAIPQTITVTVNQLTLNSVTVTTTGGFFSDTAVVTITALDPGNYLYQLEDGPLYTSNVFTDVAPGVYDVTVYDANGCAPPIVLVDEVVIVDYPKFFTPNGDGFNDTWNIFDLLEVGQAQAQIFIFDRHGKLIKQIAPAGFGWDGTYNGQPLPSSDYWFLVNYTELGVPKEFKAHFSLKR